MLKYSFTNILYDLMKLSNNESLNNSIPDKTKYNLESIKNISPYINKINKKINNKSENSFKNKSFSTTQATIDLIERYKRDAQNCKSPYDDYECAINWLNSLDEITLKYKFIQDRVKKVKEIWNIELDLSKK